jgi:nucleotide-binding universal stress UspA family protein
VSVVVAYLATAEGEAALARAIEAAREKSWPLTVVLSRYRDPSDPGDERAKDAAAARSRLDEAGVEYVVRESAVGVDPGNDVISVATEVGAGLVVIGLARRSPTGTLNLGIGAQIVLLESPCPVLVTHP